MRPFLTLGILSVPGPPLIIRRKCLSTQYKVAKLPITCMHLTLVQVSACNLHPSLFFNDGIRTSAKSDNHGRTFWNRSSRYSKKIHLTNRRRCGFSVDFLFFLLLTTCCRMMSTTPDIWRRTLPHSITRLKRRFSLSSSPLRVFFLLLECSYWRLFLRHTYSLLCMGHLGLRPLRLLSKQQRWVIALVMDIWS